MARRALELARSTSTPRPHGGESFRAVEKRVLEGKDRMLTSYAGQTVVVVSHVTPIKTLVAEALGAPLEAVYRMELAPASVSVISYFNVRPRRRHPDGQPAALQRPPDGDLRVGSTHVRVEQGWHGSRASAPPSG